MKRGLAVLAQIAGLGIISAIGMKISEFFILPIPGTLVGMILLYLLLELKVVKLEWFEAGASLLIGELLLFFIPSAIGIIQYQQLFGSTGALLLGVVIMSIITVVLSTLIFTIWMTRMKRRGFKLW